jgi:hypothetical protein
LFGKLTPLDGKTGKLRTLIDIEHASRLKIEEGPNGPRFVKCRQTIVDRPARAKTSTA